MTLSLTLNLRPELAENDDDDDDDDDQNVVAVGRRDALRGVK